MRAQRRFAAATWDTIRLIGGRVEDTTLFNGADMVMQGDLIVISDVGGPRLLAFDSTGRLRWRFGRSGAGPGEFRRIDAIQILPDGTIAAADAGNGRISLIGRDGQLLKTIRVKRIGYAAQIVGGDAGRYFIADVSRDSSLVAIDSEGKTTSVSLLPWPGIDTVGRLARQVWLTQAHDAWVATFSLGDGIMIFEPNGRLRARGRLVEPAEFPKVIRKKVRGSFVTSFATYFGCTACAAAADGDRLYVLAGGHHDEPASVVDVYSLLDARYVESVHLPIKVAAFAIDGRRLATLRNNPAPEIIVWERNSGDTRVSR